MSASYLGGNQIVSLPPGVFDSLGELRGLNLGLQTRTGACSGQQNNFTTLPPNIFVSLSNVNSFTMQCLPIQTLPVDAFDPLISLPSLYAGYW